MISIVIPACQEEKYVTKTLDALYSQDFGDFEAIVVCNGCKDNTEGKARDYPARVYSLKEGNVSKARNFGAKAARGHKIVFLDADILVTHDTLRKIAMAKAGVGSCKAKPNSNKPIAKVYMMAKNLYKTIVPLFGVSLGTSTGLIFCDREIFYKAGGFEEDRIKGEDGRFLKRARKYTNYNLVSSYVINDMRRFEKFGYLSLPLFWLKETIIPSQEKYKVIR